MARFHYHFHLFIQRKNCIHQAKASVFHFFLFFSSLAFFLFFQSSFVSPSSSLSLLWVNLVFLLLSFFSLRTFQNFLFCLLSSSLMGEFLSYSAISFHLSPLPFFLFSLASHLIRNPKPQPSKKGDLNPLFLPYHLPKGKRCGAKSEKKGGGCVLEEGEGWGGDGRRFLNPFPKE